MSEKQQSSVEARRVHRGDRIVILPPDGHGNTWAGGAR